MCSDGVSVMNLMKYRLPPPLFSAAVSLVQLKQRDHKNNNALTKNNKLYRRKQNTELQTYLRHFFSVCSMHHEFPFVTLVAFKLKKKLISDRKK